MRKKRISPPALPYLIRLCQDARMRVHDEDHFAMAGSVGGGGCNLLFESV
jgi:hypothetical protein